MLWIARDVQGLFLFRGPNPPDWKDGMSQSRPDFSSEFVDEIGETEIPGLVLNVGQSVMVELKAIGEPQ